MAGFEELAIRVARESRTTIARTREVIENACAVIQEICEQGDKVTLRGFGTFTSKTYKARPEVFSPLTGKKSDIPERVKLTFKAHK